MKSLKGFLTVFITLNFCGIVIEANCPPPEDIQPCVCHSSPQNYLDCSGINDDNVLRSVFQHSKKYTYQEVRIMFSRLKYLPQEMFENAFVFRLFIQNSTLNNLFDSPPNGLQDLSKLRLENVKIVEASHWELIRPLSHLQILDVFHNEIEVVDSSFAEYVTKELTQLTLYETGTKEIQQGVFVEFTKLEKLAIDECKLRVLSRDFFPRPFNVKHLYFSNNELKSIPDDLFTDMPRLETVGLRSNFFKTLPEAAFGGNAGKLNWLMLQGNPLDCDCRLAWLIRSKPRELYGSCATPIRLTERQLKDLKPEELKCHH